MAAPILFLPHGGGPLPLLNEPNHCGLVKFLADVSKYLGTPRAILVISAHWEERVATVSGARSPEMYYDYYGFPKEAYEVTYPAPGAPQLASDIVSMIERQGLEARIDPDRGFDHGTFVPLKLIYPEADVPVVQLSLVNDLTPRAQIDMGKAIADLSHQDVLIVGSGLSFHNMSILKGQDQSAAQKSEAFDSWLNDVVVNTERSWADKEKALLNWEAAPYARFCHPREEHLLPLHVCFGAAQKVGLLARNVFDERLLGVKISGFLWK